MKRMKKHKIKREKAEASSAFVKIAEEHDLAYYIHDRVELMHQVFSVLKPKDLKAMAPACVRRLSIDDLQELCTEELLGISSKRLLAILDGAEPPSDTESSSQSSEHLEAISLESISSDEELLSTGSKKKHKHKRRESKAKRQKKQKKNAGAPEEDKEQSKASRAGLTVLELLELQARARAIRAQLQQEQAKRSSEQVETTAIESSQQSSDSEIEIKEEPAEVVILSSSEDEKPDLKELEIAASTSNEKVVEKKDTTNNKTSTANDETDSNQPTVTNNEHNDSCKTKKKKEKSKKKDKDKDKQKIDLTKECETSKDPTPAKELSAQEERNEADVVIEVDSTNQSNSTENSNKITKRVSDLIITVPQQSSRKIKLNRNKMTVSISNTTKTNLPSVENIRPTSVVTIPDKPTENVKKVCSVVSRPKTNEVTRTMTTDGQNNMADKKTSKNQKEIEKTKCKDKLKKKKKEKRQSIDEDHDEITLQLSDTEKMDLLEDFDRKDYERVSSSSSDKSGSSDSSDESSKDTHDASKKTTAIDISSKIEEESQEDIHTKINDENKDKDDEIRNKNDTDGNIIQKEQRVEPTNPTVIARCEQGDGVEILTEENSNVDIKETDINKCNIPTSEQNFENEQEKAIEISEVNDIPLQSDPDQESQDTIVCEKNSDQSPKVVQHEKVVQDIQAAEKEVQTAKNINIQAAQVSLVMSSNEDSTQSNDKESSEEGEVSDAKSSDVEAFEVQQEIVFISDEETPKKKKKKDKKSKNEKKKKSNFRESADQNFYRDADKLQNSETTLQTTIELDVDDDDVYEILELSDDSSCYEVEGITLSKEPTDEEIAALSAKIDEIGEIERVPIITEQEIREHEKLDAEKLQANETNIAIEDIEDTQNISWKDRYLDSNKVKKVLTTSNILNALRKKNKELKKKIEESKKELEAELQKQKEVEEQKQQEAQLEKTLEEGSIEQYNTLQGLTTYVDPVPDPVELAKKKAEELMQKEEELRQEMLKKEMKEVQALKEQELIVQKAIEEQVTGEMKKDAKQLLKMYKKLLKYNDISKTIEKDHKKKKSKKKKKKDKDGATDSSVC